MNQSNKVCLITQDFYPLKGGIASYLLAIYKKYFSNTQFEVIIPKQLSLKEDLKNLPFKVHAAPFAPFNFQDSKREKCNKKIIKILNIIKPHLILFGYLRSHPEVGLQYKQLNPSSKMAIFTHAKEVFLSNRVVSKTHIKNAHKGYNLKEIKFYKNVLNSSDIIFSVSNFTKRVLQKQGINSKIIVLNPPIKKIKPMKKDLAKAKLRLPKNSLILLSVGRLIKRKGQNKIIEIMPQLKKEYANIQYLIVGNGPELEYLSQLIKDKGVQEQVKIFTSVRDNRLNVFYAACDLFILPCDFIRPNDVEGRGIVFLEASSFSKACIGGNSGGVSEAVIDKVTGLLVNPKSKKCLLNKVKFLLDRPMLMKKLGKNGAKRVSKEFNTSKSKYLIKLFNLS